MVPASAFEMSSLGTSLVAVGMVFLSCSLLMGLCIFDGGNLLQTLILLPLFCLLLSLLLSSNLSSTFGRWCRFDNLAETKARSAYRSCHRGKGSGTWLG